MNKKLNLFLISLLVFGLLTACTSNTAGIDNIRSLNVSGTGVVTVVPDIATINVGVRTEADAIQDALEGNTDQANAISQTLQGLGVAEEDIQTSNFNVYPAEYYDPLTGQTEGQYFVVENTVNVTIRDLSTLGEVLSAVVSAGANTIYGITFNVEDREAAIAEARQLAIQNAQAKAEAIAMEAGVDLGNLINISVYSSSAPVTYFDGKGGASAEAAVPIAAGTLTISIECSATYEIH